MIIKDVTFCRSELGLVKDPAMTPEEAADAARHVDSVTYRQNDALRGCVDLEVSAFRAVALPSFRACLRGLACCGESPLRVRCQGPGCLQCVRVKLRALRMSFRMSEAIPWHATNATLPAILACAFHLQRSLPGMECLPRLPRGGAINGKAEQPKAFPSLCLGRSRSKASRSSSPSPTPFLTIETMMNYIIDMISYISD